MYSSEHVISIFEESNHRTDPSSVVRMEVHTFFLLGLRRTLRRQLGPRIFCHPVLVSLISTFNAEQNAMGSRLSAVVIAA